MISLTELGPSDVAVIREVYDSDNAQELFEMELERALEVNQLLGYEVYYIDPKYFKWIYSTEKINISQTFCTPHRLVVELSLSNLLD